MASQIRNKLPAEPKWAGNAAASQRALNGKDEFDLPADSGNRPQPAVAQREFANERAPRHQEEDDSDASPVERAAMESFFARLRNARSTSPTWNSDLDEDDSEDFAGVRPASEPSRVGDSSPAPAMDPDLTSSGESTGAEAGSRESDAPSQGPSRFESAPGSEAREEMEGPSKESQDLEEKKVASTPPPEPEWVTELQDLVRRAQKGDVSALSRLRRFLDGRPEIWKQVGNLTALVETAWITAIANENALAAESIRRGAAEMRAEIGGANPGRLETLLVDHVMECWLQLQYCLATAAGLIDARLSKAYMARQESAQRCFDRAVGMLTTARRLNGAGLTPSSKVKIYEEPKAQQA